MSNELIPAGGFPMQDINFMAQNMAASGLFGYKNPEQAVALMLIAQADGLHPAKAAQEYHIIQGRPALKADAMLARFQKAGGTVSWIKNQDDCVSGVFKHEQGGEITITWDMDRAKKAQLTGRDNWKKYPQQMLRARCISEGIRATYPGIVTGMYAEEEVMDFDEPKKAAPQSTPKAATKAKTKTEPKKAAPKDGGKVEVLDDDEPKKAEPAPPLSAKEEARQAASKINKDLKASKSVEELDTFWFKTHANDLKLIGRESPTATQHLAKLYETKLAELQPEQQGA